MRALIIGITSQDGAYLAQLLLGKGYDVWGLYRRTSNPNFWRLRWLGIENRVHLTQGDISDASCLLAILRESQPDEIYNLAAQSFVDASFHQPLSTANITGLGTLGLLELVRVHCPKVRVYQASSSEMFGSNSGHRLRETDPMLPASPYAAAKLFAHNVVRIYREAYGLFVVAGILFNHESALRGLEFVTRKVTNGVAMIHTKQLDRIPLGNMKAKRDWGHAREYVQAMWLMLQEREPSDYVVATGEWHCVEELCEAAFGKVGLDWHDHVYHAQELLRPLDVPGLIGDYSRAETVLDWKPTIKFKELIEEMVEVDIDRWTRALNGEVIPWDVR